MIKMKRKIKYLLIGLFIVFLTGCNNEKTITDISYSELETMIDNKESFILEIVQTGCSHCEEFTPRFTAVLKTNDLEAYSLNLYNLQEDEAKKFNELTTVSGTPTVLFFKDGKETSNRISGSVDNDKIEEHLEDAGYKLKTSSE